MLENAVSIITFGDSKPYADFSDMDIPGEVVLHQGGTVWPFPTSHQLQSPYEETFSCLPPCFPEECLSSFDFL